MIPRRFGRRLITWTVAAGTMAAMAVTPAAAAQPTVKNDTTPGAVAQRGVPSGTYTIAFNGIENALLTAEPGPFPGRPVVLLPPLGEPGAQEWQIRSEGGASTIRSLRTGLFLGLETEMPRPHQFAVLSPRPYPWRLEPGSAPNQVFISTVVPGDRLRLDRSPVLVYPPRVDVQFPKPGDEQKWALTMHE